MPKQKEYKVPKSTIVKEATAAVNAARYHYDTVTVADVCDAIGIDKELVGRLLPLTANLYNYAPTAQAAFDLLEREAMVKRIKRDAARAQLLADIRLQAHAMPVKEAKQYIRSVAERAAAIGEVADES